MYLCNTNILSALCVFLVLSILYSYKLFKFIVTLKLWFSFKSFIGGGTGPTFHQNLNSNAWRLNFLRFGLYFRDCVGECQGTGCVGKRCFTHCNLSLDGSSLDGPWYMQEPLYLQWKQWDCLSDCRYHCMLDREIERSALNQGPVKYHGKWPFKRLYGLQVCRSKNLENILFIYFPFIS